MGCMFKANGLYSRMSVGAVLLAALYAGGSLVLGLAATWVGAVVAELL